MASTALLPAHAVRASDKHDGVDRPDTPTMAAQLAQFEKLLALRDDVTTGKHPRLKIGSKGLVARPPVNEHAEDLKVPSSAPKNTADSTTSLTTAAQGSQPVQAGSSMTPHAREPGQARARATDLNPILLEKSDTLKRAEKLLERKRVEKLLEKQLQQRKHAEKREAEQHDALPDFDVADVLSRAFEIVKPLSASEVNAANVNGSGSESIDNNTYYSSQANESETEDRADLRATKPCRYYFMDGRCLKGDHCDWSHDSAFKRKMQDPQAKRASKEEMGRKQIRDSRSGSGRYGESGRDREDGEIEEGSYSPPRVPPAPLAPEEVAQPKPIGHRRSGARESEPYEPGPRRGSGRHTPLNGDGHVFRNHITSPVAPQPSRVSPLAVTKMTRVERVRQAAEGRSPCIPRQHDSLGQSSGSEGLAVTRKRRRAASPTEANRNVTARRQMASPDPVIKAEPVSPPPILDHPRAYQGVEDLRSPATYRMAPTRQLAPRERVYVDSAGYRVPTPSRRVVSGPIDPYEPQYEPEVRRVYSSRGPPPDTYNEIPMFPPAQPLEYAPRGYHPASHGGPRRPASRATIVELDAPRPPPIYRPSAQPSASYARREPTPPVPYSPIQRDPRPMAPPTPRRIVVDQYGNRYYEAPAPEPRPVPEVAPRMSVRPETQRRPVYRESYGPPSPTYVEYREVWPPASQRAPSRAMSHAPTTIVYERPDDGYRAPPRPVSPRERETDPFMDDRRPALAPPLHAPSLAREPAPLPRPDERERDAYYYADRPPPSSHEARPRPEREEYRNATPPHLISDGPAAGGHASGHSLSRGYPPRYAEPGAIPMQRPPSHSGRDGPVIRYAQVPALAGDAGGGYYVPTQSQGGRPEESDRRDVYAAPLPQAGDGLRERRVYGYE